MIHTLLVEPCHLGQLLCKVHVRGLTGGMIRMGDSRYLHFPFYVTVRVCALCGRHCRVHEDSLPIKRVWWLGLLLSSRIQTKAATGNVFKCRPLTHSFCHDRFRHRETKTHCGLPGSLRTTRPLQRVGVHLHQDTFKGTTGAGFFGGAVVVFLLK